MTELVTRPEQQAFSEPEYGIYARYIKRPMDFFLSFLRNSVDCDGKMVVM